jgi:acetyl esterase/lipase
MVSSPWESINLDGTRLAIVGNSAGGNLSTATVLLAKAKGGPVFKTQILFWPVTDANFDRSSFQQFGTQRFLTSALMQWMWDQYVSPDRRNEIYASPAQATTEELRGLPPTLIQVAENDILLDEGEEYGRKLSEAGVEVTTVRYNGVIHDFGLLNGSGGNPADEGAICPGSAAVKKIPLITTVLA